MPREWQADVEAVVPDSTVGVASIKAGPIGFSIAAIGGSDDTSVPAGNDAPVTY